ncbi:MAG: hypothetical protein LBO74_06845 [Candidatus Symbiothrix sp.]|jgi:hypothetical protein|nr:hypothetical protein [Candidatus Symbiothrix sp.]
MRTIEFQQQVAEEKDLRQYYFNENPISKGMPGKTYTHQEVWKNVEKILNNHYGTDYKLKI